MREEQKAVAEFARVHGLETAAEIRLLDLVSELGELSKELLKSSDYGEKPLTTTKEMEEEMGLYLFPVVPVRFSPIGRRKGPSHRP